MIEEKYVDTIKNALKIDKGKLQDYFQTRVIVHEKTKIETWYSDEDIDRLGRRLEKYGVDVETQFKGRLTKDVISFLPKAEDRVDAEGDTIKGLEEGKPIFISYNIGGNAARNSGVHWVAICLVKHRGFVNVLYKDSKGDFGSNAAGVESEFKLLYGEALKFIRHLGAEQYDGSSCGPMTISNLEKMAKKIQDEGIDALVNGFRQISFIRQDEVAEVRSEHAKLLGEGSAHAGLSLNLATSKSIIKEDNLKSVEKIIEELKLIYKNEETSTIKIKRAEELKNQEKGSEK